MEIVTYAEIVVDRCTKCRGLFFDALEPEKLKRAKGSEVIDDGDAAVGEKYDRSISSTAHGTRHGWSV